LDSHAPWSAMGCGTSSVRTEKEKFASGDVKACTTLRLTVSAVRVKAKVEWKP